MSNDDRTLHLQGIYNNLYNTVTRPDYKFVVTRYFIDEWLPLLGPSLAWLIVGLRQRCFHNQRRDWCVVSKATLAEETTLSERTIERNLTKPLSRWFVLEVVHRYQYRHELGKTVRDKNHYQLLLDEPLSPRHQLGLVQLLRDAARVPPGQQISLETALATVQGLLSHPDLLETIAYPGPLPQTLTPRPILDLVASSLDLDLSTHSDDERLILLDQACAQLYNLIVQPNKIYVGWQYFRKQWASLLGPSLAWLIILMRRHCFWDESSDELRDTFSITKKDLAAALGQTSRNLANLLDTRPAYTSLFFTLVDPVRAGLTPSRQTAVCYQVRLVDEPLTPADQTAIASELRQRVQGQHYGFNPESGQLNIFPMLEASPNRQNFAYGRPLMEKMTGRDEKVTGRLEILTPRSISLEKVTDRTEKMADRWAHREKMTEREELLTDRTEKTGNSDGQERKNGGQIGKSDATLKDSLKDSLKDLSSEIQQQQRWTEVAHPALLTLIENLSIQEPARGQLLANPNLTPDTIQAWFLYAETQVGLTDPRGYAIKRLLSRDPPPADFVRFAQLDSGIWQRFSETADKLRTGQPLTEDFSPEMQETFVAWAAVYAGLAPAQTRRLLAELAAKSQSIVDPLPSEALGDASQDLWRKTLEQLRFQMTRPTFDTWLRATTAIAREGEVVVVEVQNTSAQAWLEHRLRGVVERTLTNVAGEALRVRFILPLERE